MADQDNKKITPKRPGAEEDVPLTRVTERDEEGRKSLARRTFRRTFRRNLGRKAF